MKRKYIHWILWTLASPFILFWVLFILIYLPPVQNFLVDKAADYFSEKTNMDIKIGHISLAFPLDLSIDDVKAKSLHKDTLLNVDNLQLSVRLVPLFKKQIDINAIRIYGAKVNSDDLIHGLRLNGKLGEIFLSSHGIDLDPEKAIINNFRLKNSDILVSITDTTKQDTTSSKPTYWKFVLKNADLQNVKLTYQVPQEDLFMKIGIPKASLRNGYVDLHKSVYSLKSFYVNNGSFAYKNPEKLKTNINKKGFNSSNINLSDININVDSVFYSGIDIKTNIRQFAFKESGLGMSLLSCQGTLVSDLTKLSIPTLYARTNNSSIELKTSIDWKSLEKQGNGSLSARLFANIGKEDVVKLLGEFDENFISKYPTSPLRIRAGVDGNVKNLRITSFNAVLPSAFNINANGVLTNLLDSVRRGGMVTLDAKAGNTDFLSSLTGGVIIPEGTTLDGRFSLEGTLSKIDMLLKQKNSKFLPHKESSSNDFYLDHAVRAKGEYNLSRTKYSLDAIINNINVHDFLPADSIFGLSASVNVKGKGFDFFSTKTYLEARAKIDQLKYGSLNLGGVDLDVLTDKGKTTAELIVDNSSVDMSAIFSGAFSRENINAKLDIDIKKIDWKNLGFVSSDLTTSQQVSANLSTNLKKNFSFTGSMTNTSLFVAKKTYKTKDLFLGLFTVQDSTHSFIKAGDLDFKITCKNHIEKLSSEFSVFMEQVVEQWKEKHIDQEALRKYLPDVNLLITAGKDNPLSNYLAAKGIKFKQLYMDLNSSPSEGIKVESYVYDFSRDSLMLDTIYVDIEQNLNGLDFIGGAVAKNRPWQKAFDISLTGSLTNNKAQLLAEYVNEKKERGIYLGLMADLMKNGINLHFFPEHPTIVYKPVNLNKDNYIFLSDKGQINGKVRMIDEKGSGLVFYTDNSDPSNLQDMTLEINNIALAEVRKVLPYMPNMEGNASASAHYVRTDSLLSVSTDVRLDNFKYEGESLGNWEMNGVYLPNEKGEHHIDGNIIKDNKDIVKVNGIYITSLNGEGSVNGNLTLIDFPLDVVNPFVPEKNLAMYGNVDGVLDMRGNPSNPIFNGSIALDSVQLEMPQLSANFKFDNKKVEIVNNKIQFNNYNIFTKGNNPFTIDGYVDLAKFDNINVDLKMEASNFELFNSKKKSKSILFGKMYVDFDASLHGPISELVMRGNVGVLGKTDFTYVLQDSPLVVDDRLSEMVSFVNFKDTTSVKVEELKPVSINGMDISLIMHIDQAVQAKINITPDGSNYMELEGGGDLSFQYTPQGNMLLNGRYSLISGQMKYQIPIIPLKTFNIQNGSYVEWSGNPMNPQLNITAIETMRANVDNGGENGRSVSFNVGVEIDKTLENPGLTFILSAPDDADVQDELNSMDKEERGKLAVSMLVTGMYMAPGNGSGGGFNVNNALNSFLQGEISNIVGKTLDVNLGMETVDKGESGSQTDYNFQFAKRFWNNRFRVVIGGRVSTGNAAQQDESFIDNVSIEYRLDNSGTRYIKIFHDKNYDSILEGEIVETGVGLVLRRKVNQLGELFIFKKRKK